MLGLSEAQVMARADRRVSPADAGRFEALLVRRLAGEPFAYLTGEREFWGRTFRVDRRVLIPRPETEHLVEAALELELPERPRILDVGTGSGCLAVSLALELPAARILATDVSPAALAIAAANATRLGAGNAGFLAADRLGALAGAEGRHDAPFDLIVSNPPYIDPADADALSPEIVGYEPHAALFAPGGDAVLGDLIAGAERLLAPGGRLLLEIGAGQTEAVARHAEPGAFHIAAIIRDYAGIPRVVRLERTGPEHDPSAGEEISA